MDLKWKSRRKRLFEIIEVGNDIDNISRAYDFINAIAIILNLIASILLIKEVFRTNKKWGYVLMVYPIWLSIATCLNLATWILN